MKAANRIYPGRRFAIFACTLIGVWLTCWPADAPWGGDDTVLIRSAIKANHEHRLVPAGLGGSFGYPYGPIPAQIYQLLAMISENPITLVRLHAALFAGTTAVALLYLAEVMRVNPWLAPLAMLGPFFWFYTRLMWDNTFAMPVGTLLLAAYGDYLHRASRSAFLTAAGCAIALPLIHPMTLPLVIAVSCHALLTRMDGFRKNWFGLVCIAILVIILAGPYMKRITDQIGQSPALMPPRSDALSRAGALAFPLFSGRLFCAYGFFDQRGPEIGWEQNPLAVTARFITLIAYPLIWLGIVRCLLCLRSGDVLLTICLLTLLLQSLMDAGLRVSPYPHYYCGTWAASVAMLWVGMQSLDRFKLQTPICIIYAAALGISTTAFTLDIHTHSGGSVWYGPSIGSQLRVQSAVDSSSSSY